MEIAFCASVCYIAPILIFLEFPQPREPVQNTNLKLPRVDTIIAFNEGIPQVVDGKMLKLRECIIVKIQII
ncbi:hypothetical protein HKD37_18G052308 [Glycine soja]